MRSRRRPAPPAPGSRDGPTHRRGQADRLRLRLHHHLHHAHSHLLPGQPRRPAFPLRATSRQERRGRGPEADRRRRRQSPLPVGGAVLGQKRRQHRVARRGFRHRQLLSYRAPGVLRPRCRLGPAWRRWLRHQPLGRNSRGADRERHLGQGQQGHGGALRGGGLGGRLQLHGHGLHQHQWRLDRGRAQRQPHGGFAPRPLRGQLRPQRRQRQHPRQQHLPHVLPQSSAWYPGPVRQPGGRQDR